VNDKLIHTKRVTGMSDTSTNARQENSARSGGRLVRRTFIIALVLLTGGFIAGGVIELVFRYQENVNNIWQLQTEMANGAAFKIQHFMQGIEKTMRASTRSQAIAVSGLTKDFEVELIKLLKAAPAITAVSAVDSNGQEIIKLSRFQLIQPKDLVSLRDNEAFIRAKGGVSYFGKVYFVRESEPYVRIATPIERFAGEIVGVVIAEVNLKYIWDVVSDIRAGKAGIAYVVSANGDLIAHPDISLVLARQNLKSLTQVKGALAGESGPFTASANLVGQKVFTAYATIPALGWIVLVERPTSVAYTSLYSSLSRSVILLLVGLGMAILASLMIGYRVVRPLQTLREGVARISRGDLEHHIDIQTGDELQMLADEFNEMTAKLRESYAGIEKISHLKRFFSPQLAEFIELSGESGLMDDHRREITVVFCDLRNFTEFSAIVEPEEAMKVLREYYQAIGVLLRHYEATIEHFAGDGLMAYFNDPLPCPDPEIRAVRMAMEMQRDVEKLIVGWLKRGIKLGFGIGISSGYATLGRIGSEEEFHYAAIGTVANLASRLCDKAQSGQVLIAESVHAKIGDLAEVKRIGDLSLKGFLKPVPALEVLALKDDSFTTTDH
jgi:class 3 adenylate cyclase/HAMP domain-containing protein